MRPIALSVLLLVLIHAPVRAQDCLGKASIQEAKRCWEVRGDKFTDAIKKMYWERKNALALKIVGDQVFTMGGLAIGKITPSGAYVVGQNGASLISDNGACFSNFASVHAFTSGKGFSLQSSDVLGKKLGAAARIVGPKLRK